MTTIAPTQTQKLTKTPASYADYLALPAENKIVEWVNEEVIIHMPPAHEHQSLSGLLYQLLASFLQLFPLGEVIIAPFEVKLWPNGPSREPDVLFIAGNNLTGLTKKRFEGAPDLVVEIVSPSSAKIDRVDKFLEYEKAGVAEYWLIDSRPKQQQADFYILDEDGNYGVAAIDENGRFHSTILPNFYLDLSWLRTDPLPNPELLLAEIVMQAKNVPENIMAAYTLLHSVLKKRRD